jgi:hypothetical protein
MTRYDPFVAWNVFCRTKSGNNQSQTYYISCDMVKMRFSRFPRYRSLLAAVLAVFISSCQSPPPEGPKGSWSVPAASVARLSLSVQELRGAPRRARFASADGRYVEETVQWGLGKDEPRAGLRLSEASPGPPLSDPRDPAAIIGQWTMLQDMRPAFSDLRNGENAYGPVTYWRTQLGTSVCMLFVQRLPPRGDAATTLSGFYCNPQGLPLSSQAAATVIAQIGLRPASKTP